MKKRLLSLLLVLCMVIGMLPVNALAADNEEPVTVEETAQTLPPEAEELPTEEETQPETETPETAEELTAGVDEVLAEEPLLEDGEPEPEPEPAGQVKVIVENTTYMAGAWKGTLVNTWVDINTKSTMMSAVMDALTANGYSQTGAESGYISAINGLAAFDGGMESGWMGTLNDWFTNEGFAAYTVKNGKMHRYYTCRNKSANGKRECDCDNLSADAVEDFAKCELKALADDNDLAAALILNMPEWNAKLVGDCVFNIEKLLETLTSEELAAVFHAAFKSITFDPTEPAFIIKKAS